MAIIPFAVIADIGGNDHVFCLAGFGGGASVAPDTPGKVKGMRSYLTLFTLYPSCLALTTICEYG